MSERTIFLLMYGELTSMASIPHSLTKNLAKGISSWLSGKKNTLFPDNFCLIFSKAFKALFLGPFVTSSNLL